jgi:hypothetical protein
LKWPFRQEIDTRSIGERQCLYIYSGTTTQYNAPLPISAWEHNTSKRSEWQWRNRKAFVVS